jgi:AraC-like DNA-binding protein
MIGGPMRDSKVPVGLREALDEAGVDTREVLVAAELPARVLDRGGERVSVIEYFALWRAIRDVSGDPGIGISLARGVKPDFTEPLFLAILGAESVLRAIELLASYKRSLTPEDLELGRNETTGEITLVYVWPELEPPDVLVDVELAFIVEMCRRATRSPDFAPRAIHVKRASIHAGHARFFACPIHTSAPSNAIVFGADDCARRFLTHNPELTSALLPHLRDQSTPAAPLDRVRAAIRKRVHGQRPSLSAIGKDLAMSTRALQRLLKEHGTSYRALLDEVRNERAMTYLRATEYSDGEVAFLLGFEDPNSFYRAFRAWNGMSPSEFRRAAHA